VRADRRSFRGAHSARCLRQQRPLFHAALDPEDREVEALVREPQVRDAAAERREVRASDLRRLKRLLGGLDEREGVGEIVEDLGKHIHARGADYMDIGGVVLQVVRG